MPDTLCRIELFGGPRLIVKEQTVTRFRTRKTALLLSYLASHLGPSHPREVLIDLFWPESELDAGRTSLRVALSALRKQIENVGLSADTVLRTDGFGVSLCTTVVSTDLRDMQRSILLAQHTSLPSERIRNLRRAVDLCNDIPLKGYYEEWVLQLQRETTEVYFRALDNLITLLEEAGDLDGALHYALRGVAFDALREEPRLAVARIYLARGYPSEARRAYAEWDRLVREELGAPTHRAMERYAHEAEVALREQQHTHRTAPTSVLPTTFGRLFGREREVARLMDLLTREGVRLVTITGEGGMGKTHFAVEVARRLVSTGRRDAWFVDLTDVAEGPLLTERLLRTLGAVTSTEEMLDTAVRALDGLRALLLLDNFEQMDATGAELVASLLHRLSHLQVLVTSRKRLALRDENVVRLPALETPFAGAWAAGDADGSQSGSVEVLSGCPSVELYVAQAQAVRTGFELTPDNAHAIAAICERLEGVPLALILAASRTRVLSPAQILQAIQQQLDVLSATRSTQPERHRSLSASLEWSYALLSPELRTALPMLSVFADGWDLAGAHCVLTGQLAQDDGTLDVTVLDVLDALIEASLVRMDERAGQARYRMLETVRLFCLEKLRDTGRAEDALARHLLFFKHLADEASEHRRSPESARWSSRVALEHRNLLSAMEYALEHEPSECEPSALRMAAQVWVFWLMRGYLVEGRSVLDKLVAAYSGSQGHDVFRWWGWCALGAGALAWMQGDIEHAEGLFSRSLNRFERTNDREGQAFASVWLGNALYRLGRWDEAESTYERAMRLAGEAETGEALIYAQMWLGNLAQRAGDDERARNLYRSCLQVAEVEFDAYAVGFIRFNMAQIALRAGDASECMTQLLLCLRVRIAIEDYPGVAEATELLVLVLVRTGNSLAVGAQMKGVAEAMRKRVHLPPAPATVDESAVYLRAQLGEEQYQHEVETGRSLSLPDLLALAESVCVV